MPADDPKTSYFNLLVPNVQSVRTQYLLDTLLPAPTHRNVLLTGETGVGKTVIGMDYLRKTLHTDKPTSDYTSVTINFSAQTSSLYLQETMEVLLFRFFCPWAAAVLCSSPRIRLRGEVVVSDLPVAFLQKPTYARAPFSPLLMLLCL